MNRRFLLGCLGAIGLVAVIALVFLYLNVLRPAREIMDDLKQLGELSELNERLEEQGPYTPPAGGELGAEQLERFAEVQTIMRLELGADYHELHRRAEKMRGLRRDEDGSVVKPGFRDVVESFQGLGPLLERAKAVQVEALNETRFSYPEYRWVRETTYAALGRDNADVYLEEFAERVMGLGETSDEEDAPADTAAEGVRPEGETVGRVPAAIAGDLPRNRVLAAAYADSLALWEPFLIFGL